MSIFCCGNLKRRRIGTISIYDINDGKAEMGRTIIQGELNERVEAELLLHQFGFYELGIEQFYGYIYADNKRALRFAKLYGSMVHSPPFGKDGKLMYKTSLTKKDFKKKEAELLQIL